MSLNVTLNGSMFIIPETGEVGWGGNTTSYLVAIAAGVLQKSGGSFVLSAETDFGASFGLKSLYYKSRSANIAAAGILRLNNNSDSISWRNAANNADLPLLVNASNELLYNGNQVLTGAGPSSYVSSITGTANQVIASGSTGAVTLSLPQSINSSAAVQFGTLGLGSAIVASSILSLTSTTAGFLPPRMTVAQRDAIVSPATGLFIYNTDTTVNNYYNGSAWVAIAAGGTINAGTQFQLAYYAGSGTTVSGLTLITASRALQSDSNGLPVASTVTSTELGYVSGVTSAIQTQLNTKATDTLVVHLAGTETITGQKTFSAPILASDGSLALPAFAFSADPDTGAYRIGSGVIGVSSNGALVFDFNPTVNRSIVRLDVLATGVRNVDGTAVAPAYAFSNDSDGGMYRSASKEIAFATNGTIAALFNSTQQLNMQSHKIVSLANGSAASDAAAFGQIPTNTEWASYTPTFQGLGTPTNVTAYYKQTGNTLHIYGQFTMGTTTAAEARIGFPGGFTSNANIPTSPTNQLLGIANYVASNTTQYYITAKPSVAYANVVAADATHNTGTLLLGNSLFASGNGFSFSASIPL